MGLLGAIFGGGGPSAAEQAISQQESTLASEFMNDFGTMFQDDKSMLDNLRGQYQTLTNAGPQQHGFNAAELNALQTQLLASNNAAFLNSAAVVRNFMAGQGGGATSGLTSGISAQLIGDLASKASNALAAGQTSLTLKDYEVGRENYFAGLKGMSSLAGIETGLTTDLGRMAGTELSSAFGSAKTVQKEKQEAQAGLFGAITGLATTALTGGVSAIAGGIGALGAGESFGEGIKDFARGAFGGPGAPPPGPSDTGDGG